MAVPGPDHHPPDRAEHPFDGAEIEAPPFPRRAKRWGRGANVLESVLAIALLALLAYALAAAPLAFAGLFRPVPVSVGTTAAFGLLLAVWRTRRSPRDPAPTGTGASGAGGSGAGGSGPVVAPSPWPWRLALLVALVSGAGNLVFSSEHVYVDRDPGAYVTTARWLADEGTFVIDADPEPFEGDARLRFKENAFEPEPGSGRGGRGELFPQFANLLPMLLAGAMWVGGTGFALLVPALVGSLALLVFYAFGRRLVRPWLACAATAALAANLVLVTTSRDAYSEPLSLLLVFGGLWMLWDARDRLDPARALVGGLLFGAACMARVDGLLLLAPLAGYGLVEAVRLRGALRPGDDRPQRGMYLVALGVGALVTTDLALANLVLRSPAYTAGLTDELALTGAVFMLAWAIGGFCVVAAWEGGLPSRVASRLRRSAGWLAAAGGLALAGFAVVVRPGMPAHGVEAVEHIARLQRLQGLAVDATRTYDEQAVIWIAWYAGWPVLLAAILGWAFQLRRAVLGRVTRQLPFLLVFSTLTFAYLWRHGATPDQVWSARRLLPVTMPGVLLLACLAVEHLLRARPGGRMRPWAAAGFAAAMVAWPAFTLVPVAAARSQDGFQGGIGQVCEAMGDDGAALLLRGASLEDALPQALRSFCRVPVAVAPTDLRPRELANLARNWLAEGRTLHVVAGERSQVTALADTAIVAEVRVVGRRALAPTLEHRPSGYVDEELQLVVAAVGG